MEKKKPKKPGTFEKGHRVSIGNKSNTDVPRKRREHKFISSAIEEALQRKIADPKGNGNPSTYMRRIAERLVHTAAYGKASEATRAAKEIMDRLEGKPKQAIELTGKDRGPVQMITREMTDAEASRVFQGMLRRSQGEED